MTIARRQTVTVFRADPMQLRLWVVGHDLTDAALRFAVRLRPDAPGEPLLALEGTVTPGANGIRLVEVTVDDDGVPTSLVEAIAAKALIQVLPSAEEAGEEAGEPVRLSYDLEWRLSPAEVAPFSAVEETVQFGDFIVLGSVND